MAFHLLRKVLVVHAGEAGCFGQLPVGAAKDVLDVPLFERGHHDRAKTDRSMEMARNRRIHAFTAASPPDRTPPLAPRDLLLYYQSMNRKKRPAQTAVLVLWLSWAMLSVPALHPPPASADIYRWEDEGGVIHFTDDLSSIPAKYRGKTREIQKTPPEPGRPSLSTMGATSPPAGPSSSPRPSTGETLDRPLLPQDDDATLAEKLRAKIDAKERFIRGWMRSSPSRPTRTGTASSPPRTSNCTGSTRKSSPPTGSG